MKKVNAKSGWQEGYVPENLNIGGGDYIEFTYCLQCGKIQGDFPITEI